MSFEEFATYREIKSQTGAWAEAIMVTRKAELPTPSDYEQVIFIGCGSTYYLSLAAASLYQALTGRAARGVPGGEMLLNSKTVLTAQKTLLVAISRSGTTTETVKAVEQFKAEERGNVVVIANYHDVLSSLGDFVIEIPAGQEESVAQTRSFASMYVAVTVFCARMAGKEMLLTEMDKLPQLGKELIKRYEPYAKEIGENLELDQFYFLGSGILYGLACEVNLKMKEMTLTHSEPFTFFEFRHGPMSMVKENTLVVGMLSDVNHVHEAKVLGEMEKLGGKVVSLGESDAKIQFGSGLSENIRSVLYLPILQLMAFYRSRAKELNPDSPNHLTAVVKLEF